MRKKLFAGAVAALFLAICYPLLVPLAMAAIFATLFVPAQQWLVERKFKPRWAAAGLTVGFTGLLLVPMASMLFYVARLGVREYQAWKAQIPTVVSAASSTSSGTVGAWDGWAVQYPRLQRLLTWTTSNLPLSYRDITAGIESVAKDLGGSLAEGLAEFAKQVPSVAIALAIMVVSLYFFLMDVPRLLRFVREHSMFTPKQTDQLVNALAGMCRAVILATVASGFAQAALFGSVVGLTRSGGLVLSFFLVFLCSFIPLIGAAPVMWGIVIQQWLAGRTAAALVLAAVAVVASVMDNFIRPAILNGRGNLHPLLAFVAAFGGLQTLGFVGIFLGPIIAATFVVTVEILVDRT